MPFVTVTRVSSFDEALAEANALVYGLTAGIFTGDEAEIDALPRRDRGGRRLREPARGRDHRRLAGLQTFCGWKASGSTGKGGLGPWYVPQFMREQSRTIVTP